jgi:hypothetical protein
MWRKFGIDDGCQNIDNDNNDDAEDEDDEDDDGYTSANVTVTKNDCLQVAQTKRSMTPD